MNPVKNKYSFFLLTISLFMIEACSPKTGNKILSFFFDGVPVSNEIQITTSVDSLSMADSLKTNELPLIAETPFQYHEPYLDKICDVCHNKSSLGELTMAQPELCYQCHDNFSENFKFVHGPVASGYCTACHNPHMSKSEYMLTQTGQALCLHCHDAGWVFQNKVHEGIDDYACTECHNPHGGETWYFY